MTEPLIVNGHGLVGEGRSHTALVDDVICERCLGEHPGGKEGHGRCSCGAKSEHLSSDAARKRWHREHKQAVLAARSGETHVCPAAGEKTPRAIRVDRLLKVMSRTRKPATRRTILITLGEDLTQINMQGNCPLCGYPLDNSSPHPDAV